LLWSAPAATSPAPEPDEQSPLFLLTFKNSGAYAKSFKLFVKTGNLRLKNGDF
jgi:hypothetical protein